MKKSIEELKNTLQLLEEEKNEEIRQYEELIKKTSINDRIKKGVCWYPLNVIEQGWSLGEHPFVIVERTKGLNNPHKFRAGQIVNFFSEQYLNDQAEERGVVHFVQRNKMKIILYGTHLPDWVLKGKIGVQLNFDDRSFREMEKAMKTVIDAKDERLAELRDILLGNKPAQFEKDHFEFDIPELNDSQKAAVHQALSAKDVAIIHGPPGTGKTTTLVAAIKQIVKRESPVLVCAPSNPATDLLTERLADARLNVVRIGNISRVDESLLKHTMEGILKDHPGMQEVKSMKIEAAKIRRQAERFRRNFGAQEREERRQAYKDARSTMQHAKMLEDYIIEKILKEADVITCTLVSSMNSYIEKKTFSTVVIDEAAQAQEPATWIPITKANRVILAGDPFQLPPTVKSAAAKKGGYEVTLLEKCTERLERIQLLNIQYRMHKNIMGFSNKIFYKNALSAAPFVADWTIKLLEEADPKPLEFIDTAGCGFEEKVNPESQSYYNPEEYFILRQHLDQLLTYTEGQKLSIGIIAPYREQAVFMNEHFPSDFDHFPDADISIDTVDSFQGQERDVIYICMVRSNGDGEIGFLKDTRRMNVAMTRARKKLVIVGDSATLGSFKFYQKFLDYCDQTGGYTTAWEWM